MLTTLADKVRPEHCALLLVDLQNDFCADGGAMHREGRDLTLVREMMPALERFVGEARAAGVKCVWIKNVYNTATYWYLSEVWLEQARRRRNGAYVQYPVCEPDAWNGDFYSIRPAGDEPVVVKHRYGAFEATDLDLVLRSNGIRTVIMAGVATNVCVETTARQAFLRDYYVVFTRDGTATFTRGEHEATLRTIDQFFGQVAGLDEVAACWAPAAAPQAEPALAK
jgi:ureidoacrylate peracid hydrolase